MMDVLLCFLSCDSGCVIVYLIFFRNWAVNGNLNMLYSKFSETMGEVLKTRSNS